MKKIYQMNVIISTFFDMICVSFFIIVFVSVIGLNKKNVNINSRKRTILSYKIIQFIRIQRIYKNVFNYFSDKKTY